LFPHIGLLPVPGAGKRRLPAAVILTGALVLAACGSDGASPTPDPVSQGTLLSTPTPLLYPDEAMDVRVRFTRAQGGAAALVPVEVTGPGAWEGPRPTDAAGAPAGR
jgi:hypothetical protein